MKYSEMKQAGREGRLTVRLSAFIYDEDATQTYWPDIDTADGYSVYVYVETPEDPQQPFDTHDVRDCPTYGLAVAWAKATALTLLDDEEEWEHV